MNEIPLITDPAIKAYCQRYSKTPPASTLALSDDAQKTGRPIMMSGPFLGQFLKMFSILMRPSRILELGTFTGYGTRCLLEGLSPTGKIYTIDNSDEWDDYAKNAFEGSGREHNIIPLKGDATTLIETIDEEWDLVFIDAAKRQYSTYFDQVIPRLKKGGVILADNVLWKGLVASDQNDKLGEGLDQFNKKVFVDERVENILIPIDDGINFIIKR